MANGSTSNFASVVFEPCNGAADQQWTVTPSGTIVGVQSGLCLSVLGASTANYATADIYPQRQQLRILVPATRGLKSAASGRIEPKSRTRMGPD